MEDDNVRCLVRKDCVGKSCGQVNTSVRGCLYKLSHVDGEIPLHGELVSVCHAQSAIQRLPRIAYKGY